MRVRRSGATASDVTAYLGTGYGKRVRESREVYTQKGTGLGGSGRAGRASGIAGRASVGLIEHRNEHETTAKQARRRDEPVVRWGRTVAPTSRSGWRPAAGDVDSTSRARARDKGVSLPSAILWQCRLAASILLVRPIAPPTSPTCLLPRGLSKSVAILGRRSNGARTAGLLARFAWATSG